MKDRCAVPEVTDAREPHTRQRQNKADSYSSEKLSPHQLTRSKRFLRSNPRRLTRPKGETAQEPVILR